MPDVEPERVKRSYRVVGPRRVFDTAPGDEFKAALHPDQEAQLIEGGHIEVVPKKGKEE